MRAAWTDISISRADQKWGIPVPFDPDSVVYVWFDALINYISAVGFGQDERPFQPMVACRSPHHRQGHYPLSLHHMARHVDERRCSRWPRQVFGHGFVYHKGERMSKTLGTVVDPLDAADRFGPDPLRLYFVREITHGQDGDFSWERFEARYNADLANNLGNLVNRMTSMVRKVPTRHAMPPGELASGRLRAAAEEAARDLPAMPWNDSPYRKGQRRLPPHRCHERVHQREQPPGLWPRIRRKRTD